MLNRIETGDHLVIWTSEYSGKTAFIQAFTIDESINSVDAFIKYISSKSNVRSQIFLLDETDQLLIAGKERREELFTAMHKLKDEGNA